MRRVGWLALLLLWLLMQSVSADTGTLYREQLSAAGGDTLTQQLPADARELLEALELDLASPDSFTSLSGERVLSMLSSLLEGQASGPLQAALSLLAVVVLSAMLSGLEHTAAPSLQPTYHTVAVLAAAGLLLTPLTGLLQQVREAVESVTVFMYSFVPVYTGVLTVSGAATAAVSYQTTLLAAAELLTTLLRYGVWPLLTVTLAFGCTGAVTEGFGLDAISASLHKAVLWGMGLFSSVFTWVLSTQQMVARAGDTLGSRALKFSLASFVPVVGGALSEAYSTVLGCAGLLRSTVGAFGVAAVVMTVLPPLVSCVCWNLCLHIGATAAGVFRLGALEKLCRTVSGAVRVLIAVLAVMAVLMLISTSVIVHTGKAA